MILCSPRSRSNWFWSCASKSTAFRGFVSSSSLWWIIITKKKPISYLWRRMTSRDGKGTKTYRKVIYYWTLVKKIPTIPRKKFLECHSNKSVLVGSINYAFQTWEFHLIKSFETSFDWSLRHEKETENDESENREWMMKSFYLLTLSYMKKSFFSSTLEVPTDYLRLGKTTL